MDLFEITIRFSLFLLFIALILKIKETSKKIDMYNDEDVPGLYETSHTSFNNGNMNNYLPYKKKYLLTKTEYSFYNTLKPLCDSYNLLICPKVRLEDLAEVTTKKNKMKYRGYIKSRHVDFIICDIKLNVLAAIELDDYSHNNAKARQVDTFKNNFFHTISIPLYRIVVCDNYDGQLMHMIKKLGLIKPISTTSTNTYSINKSSQLADDVINNKLSDLVEKQNALLKEQNELITLLKKQPSDS